MTKKKKGIVLMSVGVLILIACGIFYYFYSPKEEPVITGNTISIDVYVQDKEVAATSDCSVTEKVSITISKTSDVANASLVFLFEEELAQYGEYERVEIAGGVARVFLKSKSIPSGASLSSLSSCQIGHLTSVLQDTLGQYGEVEFVEIWTPTGKIDF